MSGLGPRSFSAWSRICSAAGPLPCRCVSRARASRYPRLRGSLAWTDDRSERASSRRSCAASRSARSRASGSTACGSARSASRRCRFHFPPVPLVRGLAARLLDQETHKIEPQLGLRSARGARIPIAWSSLPDGPMPERARRGPIPDSGRLRRLAGGRRAAARRSPAAIAVGQHEIELGGEPAVISQDGPGLLDPGDRLGPPLPLGKDLGFQVSHERVAQPRVSESGDVSAAWSSPSILS